MERSGRCAWSGAPVRVTDGRSGTLAKNSAIEAGQTALLSRRLYLYGRPAAWTAVALE